MQTYELINSKAQSYLNKRVEINGTDKEAYLREGILHLVGTVTRISGSTIGVQIDGKTNNASSYGVYWFDMHDIKIIKDNNMEASKMNYKWVAVVRIMEGYCNKDYAFALYDTEYDLIKDDLKNALVVVKVRGSSRVLASVKEIVPAEEYFAKNTITITSEVLGVVNMDGYKAREAEKTRLAELKKKKDAIEKELQAEILKRKSLEYYEQMAAEYSDNTRLAELVAELKVLSKE